MRTLDILQQAIKLQKPISFQYNAPNHVVGERFGNLHAIFVHPTTNNVNMDIWKTHGVSTKPDKEIPDWRQYRLEFISDVNILEEQPRFDTAKGYNPSSKQYAKVIAKI